MRNVRWLALGVALAAGVPSSRAACTLTTQWQWDSAVRDPAQPMTLMTPLVLRLTDHDGDGLIGPSDSPDIAFIHDGLISVLDGRDGSSVFSTTTPEVELTSLAAGDLDGDGLPELVAFGTSYETLVAFHHDGRLAWQVPISDAAFPDTLGIADLDQAGAPEIYFNACVHAADGSFAWRGTPSTSVSGWANLAVDLVPESPGLELLASNNCYASDGAVLWSRADLLPGFQGVGDLDGDALAEVILVATDIGAFSIQLHVLDRRGTTLAAPLVVPATISPAAPPALADLDGDGRTDVIVPMGSAVRAYRWSGAQLVQLWSAPAIDDTCCGGASVFDVDGDGSPEVLYRGSEGFHVIDGRTGAIREQVGDRSITYLETPVIADIDNDGLPELVVTGTAPGAATRGFVTAYECGVPVPTRCIWNQQAYHVTNVNEDATIPRVEVAPWALRLGCLEQESRACCGAATPPLPDVTICAGEAATLDAGSLADPGCPGGSAFEWRDASGAVIGIDATMLVSPASTSQYSVSVDCPGAPSCSAASSTTVTVVVHIPPLFTTLRARDPDTCNLGLELTWDAATFRDPSGTGTYSVYGSEVSCLDAATQPPLATGITSLSFVDATTLPGHSYFYVVQAEDARTSTLCPPGPNNGGAVNVGVVCVGPVLESPEAYTPDLLGWALRAGHVGDVVTMAWPGSRAPLPGEHFHVLKSYDEVGFARVNLEGDLSTTWIETDTSRPLQFFDVRIANLCEIQSLDDEPPGWDVPHP